MEGKIQVGQRWRTRGGADVTVTCDRQDFAVLTAWRWALSNSHIVNEDGCARHDGSPHTSDLMVLLANPEPDIRQASFDGMDSTMGDLK